MTEGASESYQQYLEQKHSLFKADSSVIDASIKKATGTAAQERQRIIAGEINEVYSVNTDKGEFIVRIGRNGKNRFASEKWVLDKVRETGISVPEVLLIDEVKGNEELRVCVEKKLPGVPLKELDLPEDSVHSIVQDAGEILAKIHSVKTQKFGRLEGRGVGKFANWEEYMLAPLRPQKVKAILESAERIGIDKTQIDRALIILADNSELYKGVSPHLLHGDFGPKHILVADGKISGILDFENAMGGDPISDFSWWDYHGQNRPSVLWLKEGYERHSKLPANFEYMLRLGKLRLGVDLIRWYDTEKHPLGQASARRNIQEDLDYFSKA